MKNFIKNNFYLLSICIFIYGCGAKEQASSDNQATKDITSIEVDLEQQNEEARKSMIDLMNSYVNSVKELNAEKVINHYLKSTEFKFITDGQILGYDETVKNAHDFVENITQVEGGWDTIYVSVLHPDIVAAMAPFHETFTDKEGNKIPLKGEITWIAVKNEGNWKFAYGHGFHQPDDGNK